MTEQAITFADPLDLVLPALPAEADCATVLVSSDLFNYLAICLGKRAYRHPRSLEFTQAGVWIEVKVDRGLTGFSAKREWGSTTYVGRQ